MRSPVNTTLLPRPGLFASSPQPTRWEAPSEARLALLMPLANWPGPVEGEMRWMEMATHGGRMWLRPLRVTMWQQLARSVGGGMEAHAGCAAWTNKAFCVLERIPLLPYYQFEVWFAGDDINDKQSALVSSSGMETASLNLNNFSIHSLWDVDTRKLVM